MRSRSRILPTSSTVECECEMEICGENKSMREEGSGEGRRDEWMSDEGGRSKAKKFTWAHAKCAVKRCEIEYHLSRKNFWL